MVARPAPGQWPGSCDPCLAFAIIMPMDHGLVRLGSRAEAVQGVPTSFMVRVYRQRPPELGDGILAPSLGLEEVVPIAVGFGVVRIDPDGLTVVPMCCPIGARPCSR